MLMQRQYDQAGKCTHVQIRHTGTSAEQNFSHRLVENAVADGWMEVGTDHLTIKTNGEPLRYAIKRTPGYYCVSTGTRIPISPMAWASARRGELAQREAHAWLTKNGKATSDYEVTNAYECVLDAAQHAQFKQEA